MMKLKHIILVVILFLFSFLFVGCNQASRLDTELGEIPVEELNTTILSTYYISKNGTHHSVVDLIIKELDQQKIPYSKENRLKEISHSQGKMYFLYYTQMTKTSDESVSHYVRGYIDVETLEVTILYVHSGLPINQYGFKLIDDNHALISYLTSVEFVKLSPYEVIDTINAYSNLETLPDDDTIAYLDGTTLKTYHFTSSGYTEENYESIPTDSYLKLYDHYLISVSNEKAYDIITQEEADYNQIMQNFADRTANYYQDIIQDSLLLFEQTWNLSDFMNDTDTLSSFQLTLEEYEKSFNEYMVWKDSDEVYVSLHFNGGGLLFMQNTSFHYVFRITEEKPIYIGSNPDYVIDVYHNE